MDSSDPNFTPFADFSEPVVPVEPLEPAEPVEPVDPAYPAGLSSPSELSGPANSAGSVDPANLADPVLEAALVLGSRGDSVEVEPSSIDLWMSTLSQFSGKYEGGAVFRFMCRFFEHEKNEHLFRHPDKLLEILKEFNLTAWAFQIERGEKTGRLHYQMFLKLKNKMRPKQFARTLNSQIYGIEVLPAFANDVMSKRYCTKEETRVIDYGGPWIHPSPIYWGRRTRC